jgi:hypothetical protein
MEDRMITHQRLKRMEWATRLLEDDLRAGRSEDLQWSARQQFSTALAGLAPGERKEAVAGIALSEAADELSLRELLELFEHIVLNLRSMLRAQEGRAWIAQSSNHMNASPRIIPFVKRA